MKTVLIFRIKRLQAALVRMQEIDAAITLTRYLPLRRDSFGAFFFFDLIDAAESLNPYQHSADIEWWNTLREHCANIIAWTNDIYSVAKDVVCGERFNLVSILADNTGIDWSTAIESAHQKVKTAVAEFTATANQPPSDQLSKATDPDRLRHIVRAAGDWHRTVSRYHLQSTNFLEQSTRQLDLEITPPTFKSRQFEIAVYLIQNLFQVC